ncbi:MAG: hypothetical protein ACI4VF_04690 [Lachnospirales bacterium]
MKNQVVVLKMRDIIKKAVFLIIGIAIIALTISLIAGGEKTAYHSGTYSSEIVLHGKPVVLNVKIEKDVIKNISLDNLSDTQSVFYPTFNSCFEDIATSVVETQSTDIEIPKDYEMTGQILLNAIDQALNKAKR